MPSILHAAGRAHTQAAESSSNVGSSIDTVETVKGGLTSRLLTGRFTVVENLLERKVRGICGAYDRFVALADAAKVQNYRVNPLNTQKV
ncbi:hypothetical protein GQ600_8551 [Phytophthora cactorum]|nr:hypothetical protein GQ600_8551 [Phytophthora cactorum]